MLLLLCGILSCKQKKTIRYTTLQSSKKEVLVTYKGCHVDSSSCSTFRVSYPFFEHNENELDSFLNASIQHMILKMSDTEQAASIEALKDSLFANYEAFKRDIPETELPFTEHIDIRIVGGYDSVLSIESIHDSYTGGAHGSAVIERYMLDLDQKKKVDNKQLLDITEPNLMKLAAQAFRVQNQLPDTSSFTDLGYFWEGDGYAEGVFRLNTNYFIVQDSVKWIYNQYEIAAYAAGTPEVGLPLNTVLRFQKKKAINE